MDASKVSLPPRATGYVVLGVVVLAITWWLTRKASAAATKVGEAVGILSKPEVEPLAPIAEKVSKQHAGDPTTTAATFLRPATGETVEADDVLTPEYPVVVEVRSDVTGSADVRVEFTETSPLGGVAKGSRVARDVHLVAGQSVQVPFNVPMLSSRFSFALGTTGPAHVQADVFVAGTWRRGRSWMVTL